MKKEITIFFFLFFLLSCHKEELPFQPKSISELTLNLEGELLQRTQLRLSFAKTVANALENVEFRDFIYRLSKDGTSNYFNEIVFAIHKDDMAVGSRTFADVIKRNVDKEVKGLFGEKFIERILKEDPLVTIKIPDIFYELDWNTEEYAPLVLSKTPVTLKDNSSFNSYYSYHYSGYQKMISNHISPEYFSITVKYSEDYILYDKTTQLNEKGIHIFDIVHQVDRNWFIMNLELNKMGIPYLLDENRSFIRKRDIFNAFASKCEPKEFTFGDLSSCSEPCKRDCLDKDNINNVLKEISVNSLIIDSDTKGSILFEENYSLLFFVSMINSIGYSIKVIDKFSLTGFRKVEFVNRNLDISYKEESKEYEGVGEVNLLRIVNLNYDFNRFNKKRIILDHLIEKGWQGNNIGYDLFLIAYRQEDIVNEFVYSSGSLLPEKVYATGLYDLGRGNFGYCSDPDANYYFGIVDFIVKY